MIAKKAKNYQKNAYYDLERISQRNFLVTNSFETTLLVALLVPDLVCSLGNPVLGKEGLLWICGGSQPHGS